MKSMEEKGQKRVCPVCGKRLCEQLPAPDDIIGGSLVLDGIKIVNSELVLECEFEHCLDEEEDTLLDEFHSLVSFIRVTFDREGECVGFVIAEIRPG